MLFHNKTHIKHTVVQARYLFLGVRRRYQLEDLRPVHRIVHLEARLQYGVGQIEKVVPRYRLNEPKRNSTINKINGLGEWEMCVQ